MYYRESLGTQIVFPHLLTLTIWQLRNDFLNFAILPSRFSLKSLINPLFGNLW